MKIISQPFSSLGDYLIEILRSREYHTFNFAVAFAKSSGVLKIKNALEAFKKNNGKINAYIGIDMKITSYEALIYLQKYTNSLNIIHNENGQTFHPKIYYFIGENKILIIVGSNNLTNGGLWTNFESSICMEIDCNKDTKKTKESIDEYFSWLISSNNSFYQINKQKDIESLLQNKYILKEIDILTNRDLSYKRINAKQNFFEKKIKLNTPLASSNHKENINTLSVTPTDNDISLWIETRKMTGGSRNILDLSKKSLVESGEYKTTSFNYGDDKYMLGIVNFFGINPEHTNATKDIIINFDGIDYYGNTILYPKGNNANGTWRLQIKGRDSIDKKEITDIFKQKATNKDQKHYLVEKIIIFSRIGIDHYQMQVVDNTYLEKLKKISKIVAKNGLTKKSRYAGIF